jgi:dTDP-4-dehydrorhamnose reductase
MKKLLVTGVSGFLGWNICQQAKSTWQVYGTYFTHAVEILEVTVRKIDLRDISALRQLFDEIKPAAIIHTAAASKPNYCQLHPAESYEINVTASVNIACLSAEYGIPYVFTSTDLVFDGKNPPYQETDPVSPISYYGEQKVEAEQKILETYPCAAICRMPLMFGIVPSTATTFIQPFIENLKAGKELNLFIDEFRTPISGTTAAKGLLLAIDRFEGIFNLGGKERISRFDFGCLLAEVLQFPSHLLKTCRQQDLTMAAPRSPDTSLDSSKAFALGYQPLSLKEELIAIAEYL